MSAPIAAFAVMIAARNSMDRREEEEREVRKDREFCPICKCFMRPQDMCEDTDHCSRYNYPEVGYE